MNIIDKVLVGILSLGTTALISFGTANVHLSLPFDNSHGKPVVLVKTHTKIQANDTTKGGVNGTLKAAIDADATVGNETDIQPSPIPTSVPDNNALPTPTQAPENAQTGNGTVTPTPTQAPSQPTDTANTTSDQTVNSDDNASIQTNADVNTGATVHVGGLTVSVGL